MMTIGIIGLGIIGGSMAKSLKLRTCHRVFGHDIDAETMTIAHMSGTIDGELDSESIGQCDVVMIALPPRGSPEVGGREWPSH